MAIRTFLHVGCGPARKGPRTLGFDTSEWSEIRLDIDPSVAPDIIASITDLSPVETGSVDAVFSSHNIEHLYPHEAPRALREFNRVLNDDGYLVITCPDILSISAFIAANGIEAIAYQSGMGPITPRDMLYGHNESIARGNEFMAHRTAFSRESMARILSQCGFGSVLSLTKPARFELWAIAAKREHSHEEMNMFAALHVPGFTQSRQAA